MEPENQPLRFRKLVNLWVTTYLLTFGILVFRLESIYQIPGAILLAMLQKRWRRWTMPCPKRLPIISPKVSLKNIILASKRLWLNPPKWIFEIYHLGMFSTNKPWLKMMNFAPSKLMQGGIFSTHIVPKYYLKQIPRQLAIQWYRQCVGTLTKGAWFIGTFSFQTIWSCWKNNQFQKDIIVSNCANYIGIIG